MTRVGRILVVTIGFAFFSPESVRGQSLLERLEKRLQSIGDEFKEPLRGSAGDGEPAEDLGRPADGRPGALGLVVTDDPDSDQLRVVSVRAGSPAERAGFEVDDIITSIGGRGIRTAEEMAEALSEGGHGENIRFDVLRDGDPLRLTVIWGTRELPASAPRIAVSERPSLGITVRPVTDDARARYGLTVRRGALISTVKSGGAAAKYGLPVGGVIVTFNGQPIETPQQLIAAVHGAQVGEEVELRYYQGAELHRKRVPLAPELEPTSPNMNRNRSDVPPAARRRETLGTELPAVRRLEELLERTLSPAEQAGATRLADEVQMLRQEVEALKRQVEELTRKLENR